MNDLFSAVVAGVRRALDLGAKVSIAVVDEVGDPLLIYRMQGAYRFSPSVALAKARTAVLFGRSTAELAQRASSNLPLYLGLTVLEGLIFGKGGLPIIEEGQVRGGVGVSGGTSDQDEEVAVLVVEELRRVKAL
jgi:uncharacterized protein GlcG (DUF336 family)